MDTKHERATKAAGTIGAWLGSEQVEVGPRSSVSMPLDVAEDLVRQIEALRRAVIGLSVDGSELARGEIDTLTTGDVNAAIRAMAPIGSRWAGWPRSR